MGGKPADEHAACSKNEKYCNNNWLHHFSNSNDAMIIFFYFPSLLKKSGKLVDVSFFRQFHRLHFSLHILEQYVRCEGRARNDDIA